MPVIWGFDLSEMRWNAFGHKQMFDPKWHLRKERFVIYQIAMLTGLAAECCATYSLAKFDALQDNIHASANPAAEFPVALHKSDIYTAQVVTIVFCVLVATVYGTDFFFLLFFPRRSYPGWFHAAKLVVASIVTLGMAAAAILSTIVISSGSADATGSSITEIESLLDRFHHPPLLYRNWDVNIAWLVLLWIAFISTVASTIIMYVATKHDRAHGTEPYPRDGSLTNDDSKFTAPPKAQFSEKHGGRPSTTTDDDSFETPARTSVSTRPGSTVDGGPHHAGGMKADKVGVI